MTVLASVIVPSSAHRQASSSATRWISITSARSCELALCGEERRLVGLELAGGQLPQPAAGDIAILPQEAHASLLVQGDRGGTTRMMHDLEERAVAVREQHLVGGDADDPSAEVQGLVVRLHAAIVTAVPRRRAGRQRMLA